MPFGFLSESFVLRNQMVESRLVVHANCADIKQKDNFFRVRDLLLHRYLIQQLGVVILQDTLQLLHRLR